MLIVIAQQQQCLSLGVNPLDAAFISLDTLDLKGQISFPYGGLILFQGASGSSLVKFSCNIRGEIQQRQCLKLEEKSPESAALATKIASYLIRAERHKRVSRRHCWVGSAHYRSQKLSPGVQILDPT